MAKGDVLSCRTPPLSPPSPPTARHPPLPAPKRRASHTLCGSPTPEPARSSHTIPHSTPPPDTPAPPFPLPPLPPPIPPPGPPEARSPPMSPTPRTLRLLPSAFAHPTPRPPHTACPTTWPPTPPPPPPPHHQPPTPPPLANRRHPPSVQTTRNHPTAPCPPPTAPPPPLLLRPSPLTSHCALAAPPAPPSASESALEIRRVGAMALFSGADSKSDRTARVFLSLCLSPIFLGDIFGCHKLIPDSLASFLVTGTVSPDRALGAVRATTVTIARITLAYRICRVCSSSPAGFISGRCYD